MRLINCQTFELEEFHGDEIPPYAILSHTWGPQEVSFIDYMSNREEAKSKDGYTKIHFACKQARKIYIRYLWVDTCCIDKSSSAELTESINSMYKWYRGSHVCYTYLADVSQSSFDNDFPESRWFSRGWTLQELLAPSLVEFYDQDWCGIGSKEKHAGLISKITQIDVSAICSDARTETSRTPLSSFSIAKRMSWASNRKTTRIEDIAYCLLGIFNVNMPLLYGEGERAFTRLQEEIIRSYDDDSIFAWGFTPTENELSAETMAHFVCNSRTTATTPFLARSPKDFNKCGDLVHSGNSITPFTITNQGLQIELPLVPLYTSYSHIKYSTSGEIRGWVGLLSCATSSDTKFPGIVIWPAGRNENTSGMFVERIGFKDQSSSVHTYLMNVRAASQATIAKITILAHKDRDDARVVPSAQRHIIINPSQVLRDIGYGISSASASQCEAGRYHIPYPPRWCPEKEILTSDYYNIIKDLVRVRFKSLPERTCQEFSVFIRAKNAIVRQGSTFTEAYEREVYNFLKENSQNDDSYDPIIASTDTSVGKQYRILVGIEKKIVFRWHIYTVSVDAIPCKKK